MALLLTVLALLLAGQPAFGQADPFPQTAAAYLVEVDGRILWSRHASQHLPPASLVKLMTAQLVLDRLPPATVVTVSRAAADATGSRLGLREKERLKAGDLVAAMLIASANDACRALMDEVTEKPQFVALMNEKARQWGMRDSHFTNGCGHDEPDNYASARDLAILTEKALSRPAIRALAALPNLAIASVDGSRQYRFTNTNALLGRCPGVNGLKTGYTPHAGKCLIATAERGPHRVLLVMLNAANRWWDAEDILNLAFAHETPQ